jgi:hypothetical protein
MLPTRIPALGEAGSRLDDRRWRVSPRPSLPAPLVIFSGGTPAPPRSPPVLVLIYAAGLAAQALDGSALMLRAAAAGRLLLKTGNGRRVQASAPVSAFAGPAASLVFVSWPPRKTATLPRAAIATAPAISRGVAGSVLDPADQVARRSPRGCRSIDQPIHRPAVPDSSRRQRQNTAKVGTRRWRRPSTTMVW